MISKFGSRSVLLIALTVLMSIKFAVLPLIEWQRNEIVRLSAIDRQHKKVNYAIERRGELEATSSALQAALVEAESFFYLDHAQIKLDLQKDVEELFIGHSLNITRFNWVLDSPGPIRTLRATVHFSGNVDHMMKVFWSMAVWPQLVRQVEWQQQISALGTNGRVTLEFYALSDKEIVDRAGAFSDQLEVGASD